MRRVFTLEAIKECELSGHAIALRRAWGNMAYEECSRCGQSGPLHARSAGVDVVPHAVMPPAHRDIATTPDDQRGRQRLWTDRVTGAVVTRAQRDAEILRLHHDEKKPLVEIAARWGLTPQRAGQVVNPPVRRRRHEGTK